MTLKSSVTTYEFSLDEVKKMFVEQLHVSVEKIDVDYVMVDISDDRFGSFPHYKIQKIKVSVKN